MGWNLAARHLSIDLNMPLYKFSAKRKPTHHVSVENFADLNERLALIATLVGRVDVLDDLAKVVRHPLKLSVQSLGQRVDPLAFGVRRGSSRERFLEGSQDLF